MVGKGETCESAGHKPKSNVCPIRPAVLMCQDLPPTLGSLIEAPWNAQNNIPIEKWLSDRQGKTDRARLHSLGNIVVPQQAFAAASCLKVLMEKANE